MRKEIERRPVDTKVLRETFRAALSRNMNKLMSEGYMPSGGISTTVNAQAKPVLGIVTQEYTQVMIKYADFEVWIKESDEDRQAFSDEHSLRSVGTVIRKHEKDIARWSRFVEPSKELVTKAHEKVLEGNSTAAKKSFIVNMKRNINKRRLEKRESRLKQITERVAKSESQLTEVRKQTTIIDKRLSKFYKVNPNVTKENLLNSR